ncbi:MAG: hypothetical protein JSV74_01670, partial [Dehalococcoidia bacterium]
MKLPKSKLQVLAVAAVFIMAIYHLISTQTILGSVDEHHKLHLALALLVSFTAMLENSRSRMRQVLSVIAIALVLISGVYLYWNPRGLFDIAFLNTATQLGIGVILITLVLIVAWKSLGPVIPCLAIGAMLYPFLGQYLPEPFTAASRSLPDTIMTLGLGGSSGLFSRLLPISANTIFYYVLFGGLLVATGA